MRITKHTDYALRVLLFLAVHGEVRVSTQTIADAYDISLSHLLKITRALSEMGLLHLYRGVNGGIELARDPEEISVGAVMRALDDRDALIECFDEETNTCVVSPSCGLKGALKSAQEAFYAHLDPLTIGGIVKRRASRLRELTGG